METITATLKRTPFRLVLRNGTDHPVPVLVVQIDRIAPRPKGKKTGHLRFTHWASAESGALGSEERGRRSSGSAGRFIDSLGAIENKA